VSDQRELPEGYVRVSVIMSEREFKDLKRTATVTPRQTFSEAIRYKMGLPYVPRGFLKAVGLS
jgi:hypothetical protein